jgi:hypothetical protein
MEHLTLLGAVAFTFAVVYAHFTGKLKVKARQDGLLYFSSISRFFGLRSSPGTCQCCSLPKATA